MAFPQGLYYSFTDGFGAVTLSKSHQLIEKVNTNGDLNPNLVNLKWSEVETWIYINNLELTPSTYYQVPVDLGI